MMFTGAMLIALLIDAIVGWPRLLYSRFGHPVTWIGALVTLLDARWNKANAPPARRRAAGVLAAVVVIGATVVPAALLQFLLPNDWTGTVLTGLLAWPLVASRSLYEHVAAVAQPLADGALEDARNAVAKIVGRDPNRLDDAGISRAALESLAENASDGIVAPLFWGAIFGLPGIVGYKAINTLDSMIGHRTERHESFGWASARIDDLANLIPARLTGLLFATVSGRPISAFRTMLGEAGKHRSPNAGWPEAAMAGALNTRLSGPRSYGETLLQEPWLNAAAPDPAAEDLVSGLQVYLRAMVLLTVLLALLSSM